MDSLRSRFETQEMRILLIGSDRRITADSGDTLQVAG